MTSIFTDDEKLAAWLDNQPPMIDSLPADDAEDGGC
jgi:hypothetical protein